MEVTSVFRRAESIADAPTSIFVISRDDIRRSGAIDLAEALRLAPNLQVARVESRTYAITARGFGNSIANKLLVMVDGRTVYSPVFSGVFWDQQDVMLEDVERIEVISGPGATQWGANAVNGVINVITRSAKETQGALVSLTGGNTDRGAALRYGWSAGSGSYRLYAKSFEHDGLRRANGTPVNDAWDRWQVGFRGDWGGADESFMLQGEAYDGSVDNTASFSGASLLGRWSRRFSDGSDVRVQAYVDYAERDDVVTFRDKMRQYDIEAQYGNTWGRHKVLLGGGYRFADDRTDPTLLIAFIPRQRDLHWVNLFAQDTIELADGLEATLGVKFERNEYTGWETLPSARIAWKVDARNLVWGAVSRAVRAPARLDREFFFPGNPPFFINGGPDFVSEVADVIEVGYRAQPTPDTLLTVSAYHNVYDKLRSGQLPPAVVQNMIDGDATGLEAWGSWQASKRWRLSAGYSTLHKDLRLQPGSTDPSGPRELGNDPRYQWQLRSSFAVTPDMDFDMTVRHVSSLPDPVVPAYTALDLRLGWRIDRDVEISLTIQNAADPGHPEFGASAAAAEIPRAAYLKLTWQL